MRLNQLCAAFALLLLFGSGPALAGSPFLAVTWNEREGDWVGVWSPKDAATSDGQYSALWRKGSDLVAADLTITLEVAGAALINVQIVRADAGGRRCAYSGWLQPETPGAARYWRVAGVYSCAGGPRLNWSARLDVGASVRNENDRATVAPDAAPPDPRLAKRWREQEGDWSGNWVPRSPSQRDGMYDARWHKGNNEWVSAFLQISVAADGRTVQIVRTAPEGSCRYAGMFASAEARTVSGTYSCSWDRPRRRLPWSATVDE